jgi:hypothetical protein
MVSLTFLSSNRSCSAKSCSKDLPAPEKKKADFLFQISECKQNVQWFILCLNFKNGLVFVSISGNILDLSSNIYCRSQSNFNSFTSLHSLFTASTLRLNSSFYFMPFKHSMSILCNSNFMAQSNPTDLTSKATCPRSKVRRSVTAGIEPAMFRP